jgi:uncharacterized protein (DUF2336 family)
MRLETESGLEVTVLEAVLECGQVEARIALARQLAALVADPDTPHIETEQVLPILLKLATDMDRAVRGALADELMTVANLNQDLIFAIVADENDIALPFLATTPSLNAWHMQAILRVGDDARQAVVAARADIAADVSSYIVRAGHSAAVAALLSNRRARLTPVDLHTIYTRMGQVADIVDTLLQRDDLPIDIRITQAKRAAVRMRQMMAERGWLPANDAAELVSDAEEGAVLQVLKQGDDVQRTQGVAFLASQNMLTPSLVVRAACLGDMQVVAATLAHLTGQQSERIMTAMRARGGAGLRSVLNRSMLPSGCHAIVSAACEVTAQITDEGITLDADHFGRRLLETLMLDFGGLVARDQAKLMDFVGRFADERVRKIARKLRADMLRAA